MEYSLIEREAMCTVAKDIFGRAISFDEQERLIDAVKFPLDVLDSQLQDDIPQKEGEWVCSYCYKDIELQGNPLYTQRKVERFESEYDCEAHCGANHGCRANARPLHLVDKNIVGD